MECAEVLTVADMSRFIGRERRTARVEAFMIRDTITCGRQAYRAGFGESGIGREDGTPGVLCYPQIQAVGHDLVAAKDASTSR
jgi:hypothetical protein